MTADDTFQYLMNHYKALPLAVILGLCQSNGLSEQTTNELVFLKIQHTRTTRLARLKQKKLRELEALELEERLQRIRFWMLVWYQRRIRLQKLKKEQQRREQHGRRQAIFC